MQNVENAAEIQQRVINLVELYRTKVGKESQIAKDAKADNDYWDKENMEMAMEAFNAGDVFFGGMYGEGPHTEVWIKHLQVNEQLLGHFYSEVAGKAAEKEVLTWLLPDNYDKTIFTDEEELFLKNHFREMVNYIILTPCDDSLEWVHRHDGKDAYTIPEEILELIKSRVDIAPGSRVYYPNTRFAQLANLFEGCTFYCDTMFYAWTKIALYANGIKAEDNELPSSYDAIISYMPKDNADSNAITRLCDAYKNLPVNGKLVLLCPSSILAGADNTSYKKILSETLRYKEMESVRKELDEETASLGANSRFRKMLVEENAVREIILLPQVMSNNASYGTYCLIIVEKGQSDHETTLIDARTASDKLETKHFKLMFSKDKLNAIMQNDGKDPDTGLRKVVKVASENLSQHILLPQVYTIERPIEAEKPVPLSALCSLESTLIRDVQYDLPEDTPWITMSDITPLFTGDVDMTGIEKADCPNNPVYVAESKDYAFDKEGKFVDSIWVQMNTKKGHHVLDYRQCTFLDGSNDVVLYKNGRSAELVLKKRSAEQGVGVAVVRATNKAFAVSKGIHVFRPKNGCDVKFLTALLRLPIVSRQLLVYEQFGIGNHLNDILVPTDKRVVGDELYRMEREKSVIDELGEKVQAMKTDYINEVRIRKHDMGQKVFDLINTEDLMRYYVENRETENDLWPQLEEQLDHLRHTIHELSDMLDHLSQEEHFGSPELINLDEYLRSMQHSNSISGFALSYQLDKDGVDHALLTHKNDKRIADEQNIRIHPTVWIAKNDIQRVVGNIISNAQKHGFIDSSRRDYQVKIVLSFNSEKGMYQIDFRNNGQPLPEGLNKMRYGIKGEKAGQTAGTGLGGSVVKSIVKHYKGDYDIFMDGEWTVVRIYLPIAI